MGLGDLFEKTSQVLTVFRADTSDMKSKMKDLQGEQRKLAESSLMAAEKQNQWIKSVSDGLAGMKKGIDFAAAAVNFLGDSWQSFEKVARRAGSAEAERAAQFRSALRTWHDGMENVKVAIGRLVTGFAPLIDIIGRTIGLIGEALEQTAKFFEFPTAERNIAGQRRQLNAGELYAYTTRGEGAVDRNIFDPNSQAMRQAQQTMALHGKIALEKFVDSFGVGAFRDAAKLDLDAMREQGKASVDAFMNAMTGGALDAAKKWEASGGRLRQSRWRKPGSGGFDLTEAGGAFVDGGYAEAIGYGFADMDREQRAAPKRFSDEIGAGVQTNEYVQMLEVSRLFDEQIKEREGKKTLIQSLFGTPDEFDLYAEKMGGLATAFNTFASAATAGFAAWVDGSLSASEAIKQFSIDFLKGIAMNMWAKSLEHAAAAIGALASPIPDLKGAAFHGKAAALYAAGAVAIGGGARSFGGGGGGSAGGAGASPGAPRLSSGGNRDTERESVINVYLGDTLAPDNQRTTRNDVARAIRNAHRELRQGEGVEFQ